MDISDALMVWDNMDDEIKSFNKNIVPSSIPKLDHVLKGLGPLPEKALFFGMATDSLPILLDLNDPIPGCVTFISKDPDETANSISMIAHYVSRMRGVDFAIISNRLSNLSKLPRCAGVFPFYGMGAQNLLTSLASWAHSNKNPNQKVVLMIDGLGRLSYFNFDVIQKFRWLLFCGAKTGAWVLSYTGGDGDFYNSLNSADALKTKIEFDNMWKMQEGSTFVRFWVPSI